MADLTFYTNPMSRGQIVRWMLEEVGAPYEQVVLDYATTLKGEEYLKINPMGKIPTIKHGDKIVTECAAICAYLADAFPEAGLAPSPADRGDYYRWLFYTAGPAEQAITSHHLKWEPTQEQQRMVGFGSYQKVVEVLEDLASSGPYVAGGKFTAADVYVGSQLDWGLQFGTLPKSEKLEAYVAPLTKPSGSRELSTSLDETIARRVKFLTAYQNADYAARYQARVEKARAAESAKAPGKTDYTAAVARYLFKLMAIKDEYEVARLYTDGSFRRQLDAAFENVGKLEFHLAPPILGRKDAQGAPVKTTFGPWMMSAYRVLAKLKFLRGGALDIFGKTAERRQERQLLADYENLLDEVEAGLNETTLPLAVQLASIPEKIRGYGHVKDSHIAKAKAEEAKLLEKFRSPQAPMSVAAE